MQILPAPGYPAPGRGMMRGPFGLGIRPLGGGESLALSGMEGVHRIPCSLVFQWLDTPAWATQADPTIPQLTE